MISQFGDVFDSQSRSYLDSEVPCFCQTCNTNWMARLENHVSPILKRMMVGQRVTLMRGDIERLRRWAAKTAVSLECLDSFVTASERARRAMYQGTTRRQTMVLLGRYVGNRAVVAYERTLYQDTLNDYAYMSWTVIVLEQVVFGVLTDADVRNPDVELTDAGAQYVVDLVPTQGAKIEWPNNRLVGFNDERMSLFIAGPDPNLRRAPEVLPFGELS